MGGTDNLAAGFAGAASAAQDILGKIIDYKLKEKYSSERDIPIEQVEAISGKSFPNIPRGTRIPKETLPLLVKQENPDTVILDRMTGKPVYTVHGKAEFQPAQTLYQPTDVEGNPVGEPTPNKPVLLKPTINLAEKNKTQLEKLQEKIDQATEVNTSLDFLHKNFNELSQGTFGEAGQLVAGTVNKIPIVPNAATPDTAKYESMRQELQGQLAYTLTGSRQGLTSLGKSSGKGIPTATFDPIKGDQNYKELKRQISAKILNYYNQKTNLGGTLSPQEQSRMAELGSLASTQGGNSPLANPSEIAGTVGDATAPSVTPAQMKKLKELNLQ